MARYDVFIAYARPNESHARELFGALAEAFGKDRIFFDREQPPGSRWHQEIPQAVADSRMTVAVLARAPNGGWYDKAELIIAVDEMRHGDHVIVPLFVDGPPEREKDWPYGLQGLSAIDVRGRGGLAEAAAEIATRVRALPAPGAGEPAPPRTRREVLEAALTLDRADQWGAVQRVARGDDHHYFLLYGQTFQNLRLFIERILHRLSQEAKPHLVVQLPYRQDRAYPSSVYDWEHRLVWALRKRLRRGAAATEALLRAATGIQPLFLVGRGWRQLPALSSDTQGGAALRAS